MKQWTATMERGFVPLPPEHAGAYRAAIRTPVKLGYQHLHTVVDTTPDREPWEREDHLICIDCCEDLTPAKPTAEIPY